MSLTTEHSTLQETLFAAAIAALAIFAITNAVLAAIATPAAVDTAAVVLLAAIFTFAIVTVTGSAFAIIATSATVDTTRYFIAANAIFATAITVSGLALVATIASVLTIALSFRAGTGFGLVTTCHLETSRFITTHVFRHFWTSGFVARTKSFCFQAACFSNDARFR